MGGLGNMSKWVQVEIGNFIVLDGNKLGWLKTLCPKYYIFIISNTIIFEKYDLRGFIH